MYERTTRPVFGFGRPWTPAVRAIIVACGGAYLAQLLLSRTGIPDLLALDTARPFEAWRWVTYLFLHDGPFHLLFNVLAIWMFGSEVEERLGTRAFVAYYLVTGAGAALTVTGVDLALGRASLVVGASGAVFGLLLAYGVLFAERVVTLLLFFVLPVSMKAKHFAIVFGAIELLFGIAGTDRIAHFAHLGGMLFGLLWFAAARGGGRAPARFGRGPLHGWRARLRAASRARDDRRMDALLTKVNERGIGALTDREKAFLHRVSRERRWR
ncbi:MAG: rhomboid family intramembrane serine protease [Acidobacteria bacterium]|nr:rhomboid family intramembrane serine protease [Acidobacteriota bacterium]